MKNTNKLKLECGTNSTTDTNLDLLQRLSNVSTHLYGLKVINLAEFELYCGSTPFLSIDFLYLDFPLIQEITKICLLNNLEFTVSDDTIYVQ